MLILRLARQAALDFDRGGAIGQNRDPVETLLPVPDRVVADLVEVFGREAFVLGLDLLQTGDRRARFFQPFKQARQSRFDPVDIERGDLHQTAKDAPQPQPEAACGFSTRKAAPPSDST